MQEFRDQTYSSAWTYETVRNTVSECRLKLTDSLLKVLVIQIGLGRTVPGRVYAEHAQCLPEIETRHGPIASIEDIMRVVRMAEVLLVAFYENIMHVIRFQLSG